MASPPTYVDREQVSDTESMIAEEPLPAGWAALAILGLSLAGWGLVAVAFWFA